MDLQVRHDHGSQYRNEDFHTELRFLSITSSPAFVRTPEGNGVAEGAFVQGAAAVGAHIPDRRRSPPCTPQLVTPLQLTGRFQVPRAPGK